MNLIKGAVYVYVYVYGGTFLTTRVVSLRIDEKTLEVIDELVRLGVFSSRTEALRELVKAGIEKYEKLVRIARVASKLLEMEKKKGEPSVSLEGALAELLEERRHR